MITSLLYENKGLCPICNRIMYAGSSIDRHHFIPKCKGGKETELIHVVCHRKIHSLFTESQLARDYAEPEIIKEHEEMVKFIKWISKKDPLFNDHHKEHKNKKRR